MPIDVAVRLNRGSAHKRRVDIVTWTCFAAVCADYTRFIDLPTPARDLSDATELILNRHPSGSWSPSRPSWVLKRLGCQPSLA